MCVFSCYLSGFFRLSLSIFLMCSIVQRSLGVPVFLTRTHVLPARLIPGFGCLVTSMDTCVFSCQDSYFPNNAGCGDESGSDYENAP